MPSFATRKNDPYEVPFSTSGSRDAAPSDTQADVSRSTNKGSTIISSLRLYPAPFPVGKTVPDVSGLDYTPNR